MHAEDTEILWRESQNTYQPLERPLADFISTIELVTPSPALLQDIDSSLLVFIKESCLKAMDEHAQCDIRREQAGILCGQAYRDSEQLYLDVISMYPVDTVNSPTHFHFHERSWESVWRQFGENPAIIGWFHTHPGHGIFLSPTDLRTQETYFSAPWQIAVVVDPVSRQFGVFDGKGKILNTKLHTIYS